MDKKEILKISQWTKEEVFQHFQTSFRGLTLEEVQKRQLSKGSNIIHQAKNFDIKKQILKHFFSIFAILLWVSSCLAFIITENVVGTAIMCVVIVNGIFSFYQELKADKILSSLHNMIPKKIQVYRNNLAEVIDVVDLTIGDLVVLDIGTTIPADARLIEANNFFVDNSMLSGETIPLNRNALPNIAQNQVLSEIPNVVYAGTTVAQGSAKAVIYAIGNDTQIGEVSNLVKTVDKGANTLEKEIQRVIKKITIIASALGFLVFIISLWKYGKSGLSGFKVLQISIMASLGILVANIPEGLLPTMNLSLSIGSQRMAKQKALIKKLLSVETLNSATVICTDKTGTLTKNQLTCRKILLPDGIVNINGNGLEKIGQFQMLNNKSFDPMIQRFLIATILCSETNLIDDPNNSENFQVVGNPLEGSLLIAAFKYGLNFAAIRKHFNILKINPFSSETKKMSVLVENLKHKNYDLHQKYIFVKGAPSVLLQDCRFQYKDQKVNNFSERDKNFFINQNEELSSQGFRILAVAYKPIENNDLQENDMIFLGFAVHYDPPKIDVYDAVQDLYKAGLKITMITGDYGATAVAIGKQVGIIKNDEYLNINGIEVGDMSALKLQKILRNSKPIVFSRTTPKHKLKIIEAYRANGEIVGVIGDGVNDILALKSAHIGIVMGKSGKDVARNVADMILLNDDFKTIPKAVLEARGIYTNIKKFMSYVLISNMPQIFPVIFMIFFNVPLYLTIMQILAIDLITDLIPAIALGAEEPDKNLLVPINKKEHLLDKPLLKRSYGFLGIIEGFLSLLFFLMFGGYKILNLHETNLVTISTMEEFQRASTMAFGAVIFSQIGNVFACRSHKLYFWQTAKKKNTLLYIGILVELILFILISRSFTGLNKFFGTMPIQWYHYLCLCSCVFIMLFFDTIYKFMSNKKTNTIINTKI
ncbi:cation-translocating P-type ATPase [Candidatus Phytoplasma phoenicium]|uniref:Cation-transporting P-type ATPase B n=1 Tax=Candidatus Phytoplasma phoenicium TaxID=198422 RepID=A0A0L0MK33_9MOLU|nr:cation-transporting P-type ATPase [Candidatus Phytoplasma phoenicium]KND62743.1 Cation-transporting P-type ATPase B [Candidatus Phytoplasma phoenicium]